GVVKMNVDTDTQWAYLEPIKQYMDEKNLYLQSQLGNPEGPDKPNKKFIDPRNWLHVGEKGMAARVVQACKDLGSFGQFEFLARPSVRAQSEGRRPVLCSARGFTGILPSSQVRDRLAN